MMTKQATVTRLSDTEVMITREFDAPRDLVWEVWHSPEHMPNWYGPAKYTMTSCEIDLRPGGAFRWVTTADDGGEHPFSGTFLEVEAPARVVATERYEPVPQSEHVTTATFDDIDGRTLLTAVTRFETKDQCEGYLASGMEGGMQETMRRLDHLLASLG